MRVLLLSKTNAWCRRAAEILLDRYPEVRWLSGDVGTPLPPEVHVWSGDLLISFCSPWIVPPSVLAQAGRAVNFHPAPPEHPGFAPYSWAIYEGDTTYGCTVHQMSPTVDSGPIIQVVRFPIHPEDSVWDLQQRALAHLLGMLHALTPADYETWSPETWTRAPRTRRDFETLRACTWGMSPEEIARRTRACAYPGHDGVYLAEDSK